MSYFFTILQHHQRFGIFVPRHPKNGKYPSINVIEKTLAWYREDGKQPKIENDDPGTFFYRIASIDGYDIDAIERVKT